MCGKEGYQSIRHIQKEHNKFRKRFNSQINQFILNYKEEEAEESFNKLIEALIIDFDLDIQEQETSEAFLTTFGPFTDS